MIKQISDLSSIAQANDLINSNFIIDNVQRKTQKVLFSTIESKISSDLLSIFVSQQNLNPLIQQMQTQINNLSSQLSVILSNNIIITES